MYFHVLWLFSTSLVQSVQAGHKILFWILGIEYHGMSFSLFCNNEEANRPFSR